jgi:branched-chain amino acid transport system substrate-binding protein
MSRYVAALGVAAVLLSSGCTMVAGEPAPEVVVIGADLELSGDDAGLGNLYLDALRLRVEQVNRQGLLSGNRRLELEVLDNRSDPATSAGNLENLAGDPAISAIVSGSCAECLLGAVEAINEAAVPTISLAAADEVVNPVAERPYIFKVGPNTTDTASFIAAELAGKQIGLISTPGLYGEAGAQEMRDAEGRTGITVVVDEQITPDPQSLAAAADRIVSHQSGPLAPGQPAPPPGPEAVVVWSFSPLAGEFAVSLRAAGYEGPLYLDAAAADELFLTGDTGDALAGARLVFTETLVIDELIATSPAKASRKTWFRDYSARYGTYHAFSSFAADAIGLVVAAVNRIDSTEREAVRDAFERTQMDGLSGPLRITPDNHSGLASLGLTLLVARGDRWQPAD